MELRNRKIAPAGDDVTDPISEGEPATASTSSEDVSCAPTKKAPAPIPTLAEVGVLEVPDWDTNLPASFSNDLGKSLARRLFHWGPMIAISIIFYISITATFLCMEWWPLLTWQGIAHMSLFLFWVYSTLTNLALASQHGPGYVPINWNPPKKEMCAQLQKCSPCGGYKAPRSHHCSKCGRCSMKMDHHCPWINNCVGHRNQALFVRFLSSAVVGCTHAAIIIGASCYHGVNLGWYERYGDGTEPRIHLTLTSFLVAVGAFAMSIGVTIAVGALLVFQLRYIAANKTGIEDYIVDKARSAREHYEEETEDEEEEEDGENPLSKPFVYPYDIGRKRNFKEVLGSWSGFPSHPGVWWPIRTDCTQFTLSEEQLHQKELKRQAARLVEMTGDFKGGVCGSICSPGPKAFICQPISEEARVATKKGDRWIVTRGNRHWLYGMKKTDKEVKGWFPRAFTKIIDVDPWE